MNARDRSWLLGQLPNEICHAQPTAVARRRAPGLCAGRLMRGEIEREVASLAEGTAPMPSPIGADWPFVAGKRLAFLLDAATSIERRLLDQWIDVHRPEAISPASCERIAIPSSRRG